VEAMTAFRKGISHEKIPPFFAVARNSRSGPLKFEESPAKGLDLAFLATASRPYRYPFEKSGHGRNVSTKEPMQTPLNDIKLDDFVKGLTERRFRCQGENKSSLQNPGLSFIFPHQRKTNGSNSQGDPLLSGYLKIVERKIREAVEKGEFDNLPGKGKPLVLEDDSHVPEDLRIAYRILKNADCLPPEIQEKKEIMQMEDLLASIPDDLERYKLIKKINYRIMKLNMSAKRSPLLEEKQIYFKKLIDKFAQK
jgi:hypothetical protein